MPQGKGTYGSKVGRPPKKNGAKKKKPAAKKNGKKLSAKQKTLPKFLQDKISKSG